MADATWAAPNGEAPSCYLSPGELARFMALVEIAENGCWLWKGPLDKDGYGSFFLRRRTRRAHRVGYYMRHGAVPDGMHIDHSCHDPNECHAVGRECPHRRCVNPEHVRAFSVNASSLVNSNSLGARNALKTHCPRGHPYDVRYKVAKTGRYTRYCSVCEGIKSRRLRQKWIAEDTLNV